MSDIKPRVRPGSDLPLCNTACPHYRPQDDTVDEHCAISDSVAYLCEPAVSRMAKSRAELLVACEAAEDLIGFYEGSEEIPRPGMYPQILLNAEDHATLLATLRAAISNATPTTKTDSDRGGGE